MNTSIESWDNLVAWFRSLGGVLENITIRSENGYRSLVSIDRQRDSRIHVPNFMLIDADDVRVENGQLKLAPETRASAEARAFFEAYHRFTSWSDGGRSSVEEFFTGLQALPTQAKTLLSTGLDLGHWFEPISDAFLMRHFLDARRFTYEGRQVLAPLMEFTNHDGNGTRLSAGTDGLTLNGRFAGEIAWRYRTADTFQIFRMYRFPSIERFAFSLPFDVSDKRLGLKIHVGIDTNARQSTPAPIPLPVMTRTSGKIDLSFIVLADRNDPRLPFKYFKETLGQHLGRGALEFFEGLLFYNRQRFFELMSTVEGSDGPAAQAIRKVCRLQLESLNMVSLQ